MNSKVFNVIVIGLLGCSVAFSQETVKPVSHIDLWDLPALEVYPGKYLPDWESLSRYEVPDWFREAKLGIWSHWNPQSVPEAGGWYARWMYVEGDRRYTHCLEHYGHPSEFGYKDLCGLWTCEQWDPDAFIKMALEAGGKYFVAMANHHDNYDSWDSTYQPWNSVNLGPKKDVIGIWKKTADKYNIPFGVSVHASPARTWGQFVPVRFNSDKEGPYKGVPYDAATATLADGEGKPWEGLDPKDLYGFDHKKEADSNQSPFANQFMWRVDDLLKYNPALLYFDESVGVNGIVDLGVKMGFGYLAPQIAANYYNRSMAMNQGREIAVLNIKAVGGKHNSLATPEEAELVTRCLVQDSEKIIEGQIEAYPFQTDDAIGPWFYNAARPYYRDARWVIHTLVNNVSKNGNLLLGIPQRAQGNVDPEAIAVCRQVGKWLKENGEGIYGSRPFEVFKSKDQPVYFTRKNGYIYAFCLQWPKASSFSIDEFRSGGATVGAISKVELLGYSEKIKFVQNHQTLSIELPEEAPNKIAAVFKIIQDKCWINDDDPGVRYAGWIHRVNRNRGEYNNDVYESHTHGNRCLYRFKGTGIQLIGNTGPDLGRLTVLIDGVFDKSIQLNPDHTSKVQQVVYTSKTMPKGEHTIEVINASDKLAIIDAFVVTSISSKNEEPIITENHLR